MPLKNRQGSRDDNGRQGSRDEGQEGSRKGSRTRSEDSKRMPSRDEESRQVSRSNSRNVSRQNSEREDGEPPQQMGRVNSRTEQGGRNNSRSQSEDSRNASQNRSISRENVANRSTSRENVANRSTSRENLAQSRSGSREPPLSARKSSRTRGEDRTSSRDSNGRLGSAESGSRKNSRSRSYEGGGSDALRAVADANGGERERPLSLSDDEHGFARKLSDVREEDEDIVARLGAVPESPKALAVRQEEDDEELEARVEAEQERLRQKTAVANEIAFRQAMNRARKVKVDDDDDNRKKKKKKRTIDDSDSEGSNEDDGLAEGEMEANRPGLVPIYFGTVFWVLASSVTLFLSMYIYKFQEAFKFEFQGAEGAALHAKLHAGQLLAAAPAVVQAVEAAFRSGAVRTLSDYDSLLEVLTPHFHASPALSEVHLADEGGSVLVSSYEGLNGTVIEIRSERPGCEVINGSGGCTVTPLRATRTTWYKRAKGMYINEWYPMQLPSFWEGPTFRQTRPHEVSCPQICYASTYAFVARLADGDIYIGGEWGLHVKNRSDGSKADKMTPIVVRAAVDTERLRTVIIAAERISRGEAFLCTAQGALITADDSKDIVFLDAESGAVRAKNIWELSRDWAYTTDQQFVEDPPENGILMQTTRITAWKLDALTNATPNVGDVVRIVMAVPQEAFIDTLLGPIVPFCLGVGGTPPGLILLATLAAGYARFCRRSELITDTTQE